MNEIRFGLVAKFYFAHETLIPNASYRPDINQEQTRQSIEGLKTYFQETGQPGLEGPTTVALEMAM